MQAPNGEVFLRSLGLQRRRAAIDVVLPAAAAIGAGVLVGLGLGFMLAPKAGRELRSDIGRTVSETSTSVRALVGRARAEARKLSRGNGAGRTHHSMVRPGGSTIP